jgi:hypothetical protein
MAKSMSTEDLILEALERALADPEPRKLHGTKASPGIFLASSAPAKAAAQQCLEQNLIATRGELKSKGKMVPLYGVAPAGVAFLLEHDPVRKLLTTTQAGVEHLSRLAAGWNQTLVQVQQQLAVLGDVVQHAATRLQPPDMSQLLAGMQRPSAPAVNSATALGTPDLLPELLNFVHQQKRQAPLRPVELPQLYRFARSRQPALTMGQFHDQVRRMAETRQVRLSPFTQAMYQLAEPECAMIIGRELMYYVDSV